MTKVVGVRFRNVGKIYYFSPKDYEIKTGDHVIVETARGIEYGKVVLAPREVASFMPLKPEDVQYRLTMREQESTQRFLRVNIWGCTERSLSEIMIR